MKYTTNLNLKKPEQDEFYNVDDFNTNADILDEHIGTLETTTNNHLVDMDAHANLFADVVFYVASNGSDSNDGKQGTPFKTIQKAVDSLPISFKGAIINIGSGTYNELVSVQKKPSGTIVFQGGGIDTTVVNGFLIVLCNYVRIKDLTVTTTQDSAINVQGATFTLINAKLNTKSGGNYGLYTHTVMGLCVGVEINNAKNAIRANYSTLNCQQMSGSNNQIGYYAIASIITVESITNIGSTSPIYPATGGAIIDNKTGTSLSTGVADKDTDKDDSSKKLVTSEFLKKANQWSMPSSSFITIPQGWVYDSNNARFVMSYTATANGHINYFVDLGSNANAKNVEVGMTNLTSGMIATDHSSVNKSVNGGVHTVACTLAVCKGETVQITMTYDGCTAISSIWCPITVRFVYAKGEVD